MQFKKIILFLLLAFFPVSYLYAEINFNSPIVKAADSGTYNNVASLIRQGSDINVQDIFGTTALMRATINGHYNIAELLLNAGANPDITDDGGATSLHIAARQGNPKLVKLLLIHNASINVADKKGWTPIMRALNAKHNEVFEILLAAGADINLKNNWGQTALTIATQNDNRNAVEKLLLNNSKTEEKDETGDKAIDIAKRTSNKPVKKMLSPNPKIQELSKESKKDITGSFFLDFGDFQSDQEIKSWWENLSGTMQTAVKGLELYMYMPKEKTIELASYRARAGIITSRNEALEKCETILTTYNTCNIVEADEKFTKAPKRIKREEKNNTLEEILPWLDNVENAKSENYDVDAKIINKDKYLANIQKVYQDEESVAEVANNEVSENNTIGNIVKNNDVELAQAAPTSTTEHEDEDPKSFVDKFYDKFLDTSADENLYAKNSKPQVKDLPAEIEPNVVENNIVEKSADKNADNFQELVNEEAIKTAEHTDQMFDKQEIVKVENNTQHDLYQDFKHFNVEVMEAIPYIPKAQKSFNNKKFVNNPRTEHVKLKESIWLQVGNFISGDEATYFWKKASSEFNTSSLRVKIIEPNYYQKRRGKSNVYVRLGLFDYENDAKDACKAFTHYKDIMCNYTREVENSRPNFDSKVILTKDSSRSHSRYLRSIGSDKPQSGYTPISEKRKSKDSIYWVHLGSYKNLESAKNYYNKVKNHYPNIIKNSQMNIQTIGNQTKHKLFNLRVGPFDKYNNAGDVCNSLQSKYVKCVVM